MAVSYNRLWKLLIDKKISKADLCNAAGLDPNTMTKLCRDEPTKRCFGLSLFMPASTIMWGNYAILLPSHVR